MAERVMLAGMGTGEAIREYLLTVKEGNPYEFFKVYSMFSKRVSYDSVRRYFWILKEIGLIEPVRFEVGKAPFRKHLYRIVPGREDDPRWLRPQIELYPDTRLGRKGYEKLRKKGLKPKGGRRRKYR